MENVLYSYVNSRSLIKRGNIYVNIRVRTVMENLEKSWKSHGNPLVNMCKNPEICILLIKVLSLTGHSLRFHKMLGHGNLVLTSWKSIIPHVYEPGSILVCSVFPVQTTPSWTAFTARWTGRTTSWMSCAGEATRSTTAR